MEDVSSDDLDPRWRWVEVPDYPGQDPIPVVRGACKHLEWTSVEDLHGELIIELCLTCGKPSPLG